MQPLAGCLLGSEKPEPGLDIPVAYSGGPRSERAAEVALPKLDWWRGFHSRELTEIIEQARASNLDIAAAVARVVQADAQARITGAALLPEVDLNGNATRSRSSQTVNGGTTSSTGGSERTTYTATLNASYEIDFWGKNRAALRCRGRNRRRHPLRPRSGRPVHRRCRRQRLFPGTGGAGSPAASPMTTSPAPTACSI